MEEGKKSPIIRRFDGLINKLIAVVDLFLSGFLEYTALVSAVCNERVKRLPNQFTANRSHSQSKCRLADNANEAAISTEKYTENKRIFRNGIS